VVLKYDNMDTKLKIAYDAHRKELAISYGVLETAKLDGRIEGKIETAKALKQNGVDLEIIAKSTGLSIEQIENL
jgi:predicted transposase/invertase (TIGR01784 family)